MKKSPSSKLYQVKEIELIYKPLFVYDTMPKVTTSRDAFNIFRDHWNLDGNIEHIESFRLMLLNRANRILGVTTVSTGGVAGCIADPKVIFQYAVKGSASGIIVAHNHPSGNLTASQADIDLTKKLKAAGLVLEIQLLDHLILTGDGRFYSFADEGMI